MADLPFWFVEAVGLVGPYGFGESTLLECQGAVIGPMSGRMNTG